MNIEETIIDLIHNGHNIALWGVSRNNLHIINELTLCNLSPDAIIDSDSKKYGLFFHNIPIISFQAAIEKYPEIYIYISESFWKYKVINDLLYTYDFPKERIINYENVIRKTSCPYIESAIIIYPDGFGFCCSDFGKNKSPIVSFDGDYDKSINNFIELKEELSGQIQNGLKSRCYGCKNIIEDYFPEKSSINMVSYSVAGVCNLNCSYCTSSSRVPQTNGVTNPDLKTVLNLLKKKNILSDHYHLDFAPGEPTLFPERIKYYKLFPDIETVTVLTNATRFDEELSEYIVQGRANLLISLDAGTRNTYRKLKGRDLWNRTVANIKKYSQLKEGCIDLKYIFCPGINDNKDDISGFIDLCNDIKPASVFLSYDFNNTIQDMNSQLSEMLFFMIDLIEKSGIVWKNMSDVISNELKKRKND